MAKRETASKEEVKEQPKVAREPVIVKEEKKEEPAPKKKDGGCRI